MKKILCLLLVVSMAMSLTITAFAETPIKVVVGGEKLVTDVAPVITEGRTMLPVRAVFEAIGADVSWIGEEQKVVATKKDKTVEFVINSNVMKINGEEKIIDVPAMIIDSRTLVPVRACAEAFDLKVEWDGTTRTVKIKKKVSLMSEVSYGVTWIYTYDENGKTIKSMNAAYNDIYITYEYDAAGNLIKQVNHATGNVTTYTYDENGNMISTESSDGSWERNEYDDKGNIVFSSNSYGTWKKYEYNNGILVKTSDSSNEITTYEYDENNNLVMEQSGDSWKRYEYDSENKLKSFTDSYGVYMQYEYDEEGNLIRNYDNNGGYTKYIIMEI